MTPRMVHASTLVAAVHTALVASLVGASAARAQLPATGSAAPSLVVLITVDQMRADYYDRFKQHMQFGLPRLFEQGAVFTEAYQDHAYTETAPGHASTLSGRFPVHTGIATNAAGVNTSAVSVLGGGPADQGASPFRFRGTTLVDWMRAANPATRFLSVSRKDRGAILPIGTAKGDVYWFTSTAQFSTSTYYADTLPTWVRRFNDRRLPATWAGAVWRPMYGAATYAEPDSVPVENGGKDFVFPHTMPRDPAAADTAITQFPWMDDITLQFALDGVQRLGLGATAGRTDLLAVSLSTTDAIGHRYGPDSKELHDHLLQLDRFLGTFLDSLYKLRDSSRVVIALTSDHGMTPYPTLKSSVEPNEGAQRVDLAPTWAMFRDRLARVEGADTEVRFADNILTLPVLGLALRKLNPDSVAESFVTEVMRVQGVMRADLVSRLPAADTVKDAIARRWLHVLAPSKDTVQVVVTFTPHSYAASVTYATHGSPHDGDAHVPLVFRGPGIRAGRVTGFARVVDLAPTLAALLGVRPLEPLDGRPLTAALRLP